MLPKIGKNKVPKVTPGYPKFWPFLAVSKMPKNIIFGGILCREIVKKRTGEKEKMRRSQKEKK